MRATLNDDSHHHLGELLRLALENTHTQEVPLQREIHFLRCYLEIEQVRFGDRLQLKMEVDPSTLDAAVPNLILQPLVENAIRHAIEPQEAGGQIELRAVTMLFPFCVAPHRLAS